MTGRIRLALAAGAGVLAAAPAAAAATYTVRSTGDALHGACGPTCTLRDAVRAANAHAGADTIVLGAHVYRLTRAGAGEDAAATGDLDITSPVTVVGAGSGRTTIDLGGRDRAFDLVAASSRLVLRGVRVTGAKADTGGCIRAVAGTGLVLRDVALVRCRATGTVAGVTAVANAFPLTLDRVRIERPVASGPGGGVLFVGSGPVVMRDVVVRDAHATLNAGILVVSGAAGETVMLDRVAILDSRTPGVNAGLAINLTDGVVALRHVRVTGNVGGGPAAGATVFGRKVTVSDSEFSDNRGGPSTGLAVFGTPGAVPATIERTTVARNRTSSGSPNAGILLSPATLPAILRNVTVVGNAVAGAAGAEAGITSAGPLTLRNVTVAGNTASRFAGVHVLPTGALDVANSILGDSCTLEGPHASKGGNIDRGVGCALTRPTDRSLTDPLLGPLGAFGGGVRTVSLQAGSPAIDRAVAALCPKVDARGVKRPRDGNGDGTKACDIGAYER